MTLRRRLLFGTMAVAAVTLVAGIIGGILIQREVRNAAQRELFRQGQVTAELVERELERTPLRNRGQVAAVLESVQLVGGHDFVEAALLLPGGRVSPLGDDAVLIPKLPLEFADRGIVEVDVEGTAVLATVRRVSVGNRDRRDMVIAIGRIEDLGVASVITRTVLFALIAGALLAVALSIGLSKTLGSRLEAISGAARSYADGDFTARAPASGSDELAAVGRAFNDMAAELDDARRRERDFLMSVGHDLRTPLTTIRGYAEGLDTGAVPPEDIERVAGVIHVQTDRLSRLIEDLMLLARLEAREFTLRSEPVDLAAHIKETIDGARIRADAARVRIEADLQPVGLLPVDPDRVAQIVTNLIDNALRYTPEGGRVVVALEPTAVGARIVVADNGPGIEPEDLPHVFERLYVAQHYRPVRPEGSGLGLSIIKELIDAMGGVVEVTSQPGVGTAVSVVLVADGSGDRNGV
jgi:two-component system sensor histidine kinase BaeS